MASRIQMPSWDHLGGVTPAGDDSMLRAIHTLWASGDPEQAQDLSSVVVEAASPPTNAVSLAWLRAAQRGEAGNEWRALFSALVQGDPLDLPARVLIRRGHTSGADSLAGFLACLGAHLGVDGVKGRQSPAQP